MSNALVDRLSVDKKQISFFAVPPFPAIPAALVKRVPELTAWTGEISTWRDIFSAYLKQQIMALARADEGLTADELAVRITELEAALRHEINEALEGVGNALTAESILGKVNRAGDTMTGPFILWRDPELDLEAVTKQYLDRRLAGNPQSYVFEQSPASATWTINHHRGKYPGGITVMTGTDNDQIIPMREDPTKNQVILTFGAAYTGRAILPF